MRKVEGMWGDRDFIKELESDTLADAERKGGVRDRKDDSGRQEWSKKECNRPK